MELHRSEGKLRGSKIFADVPNGLTPLPKSTPAQSHKYLVGLRKESLGVAVSCDHGGLFVSRH